MTKSIKSTAYAEMLGEIKAKIAGAQYEVLKVVNKGLIAIILGYRKSDCRTPEN